LPAPTNAEATRGTATAERPTEAEPPKAELPQAETPKLEPPKAELDSKSELQLAEATALAERFTATAVGPAPSSDASISKTDSGADTTASISKNIESLTALVLTGLEVGEISDLAGKVVAINGALPGSSVLLRTAIVAAGAPEVQLNDSQPEPIEALRRGEVSAVILGLVTVEQARAFPKVENFKLFRVPLSPG
jgi:ABC-type amino acid transport substrate-binding protein